MSAASVADKHIFNENIHHYYSVGSGDADRSRDRTECLSIMLCDASPKMRWKVKIKTF